MIFQTYGVSSHHDGHSNVCSMGIWFLLHTVCCNCCKRLDRQHSLLCSLYSAYVLQWPQKMTSQYQQGLSFCSIPPAGTVKSSSYFSTKTYVVGTQKNSLSRIPSECQIDLIQIRADVRSGLIWVQTVCKRYQQTTLVGKKLQNLKPYDNKITFFLSGHAIENSYW